MSEKIYSKVYQPGEDIVCIGDRGRNAYFIERGKTEVTLPEDGGKEVPRLWDPARFSARCP